jgi:hypothetical protein
MEWVSFDSSLYIYRKHLIALRNIYQIKVSKMFTCDVIASDELIVDLRGQESIEITEAPETVPLT